MQGPVITRSFLSVLVLAGALSVAACDAKVAQRGAMPDVDLITQIVPQKTSKTDVERLLGSPSSINMFGDEVWMYIGETTEQVAFLEREVAERSVLVIHFDKEGVVSEVESHGLDIARDIQPVERETPTVGRDLTLIEQLMGNVSRLGKIGQQE